MNADDDDRGLQFERTTLAWWRTGLATVAVGVLVARQSDPGAERWLAAIGVGAALLAAVALATMRMRQLERREPAAAAPGRRATMGLAGALAVLQLVAAVLVLA